MDQKQNMRFHQSSDKRRKLLLRKKKMSYKRHTILIMWALFLTYFTFSAGEVQESPDFVGRQDLASYVPSYILKADGNIRNLGSSQNNASNDSSSGQFNTEDYDDESGSGDLIEGVNCTPPAIADFPADLFTQKQRAHGAIVVHFLASLYIFYTIALVCDDFFVPSIECICEDLHLSSDVGGATFMAVATSAPELFTNIVGTFITKGDIGLGTIVGSAVFNILAIGACCGLAAKEVLHLEWWPLTRDCLFYSLSVIALILIQLNRQVYWYEALALVLLYCVYILVMYNNVALKEAAENCVFGRTIKKRRASKSSLVVKIKAAAGPESEATPLLVDEKLTKSSGSSANYQDILGSSVPLSPASPYRRDDKEEKGTTTISRSSLAKCRGYSEDGEADENADDDDYERGNTNWRITESGRKVSVEEYDELLIEHALQKSVAHAKEEQEEGGLFILPRGASIVEWTEWVLGWPARFCLLITMPDCRQERMRRWYPLTFIMCIVWIGALSYIVSWLMTVIGHTFGIPDSVMGLTFIAAGTSVPEAVSSIIVARQGLGSMGISNSIGSNTFDILICLGLPWLIRGSLVAQDEVNYIHINSSGFGYTTIMLMSSLVLLYTLLACNRFILDKKVSFIALLMYAIFLVIASLMELNIFFPGVNLPACPTDL